MALAHHVVESLVPLGGVKARRMFGGVGIFRDGVMFAIVVDDVLYLKTNEAGSRAFAAEGLGPYVYGKSNGSTVALSYWRAPERLLDDNDELLDWAQAALAVACANATRAKTKVKRS